MNARCASRISRLKPLALALTLALTGVAGVPVEATVDRLAPAPRQASARAAGWPGPASLRPDGSILWFVTNCDDAGPGSLRDAAAHANHGDGIDLTALNCSTISLTSGAITLRDVEITGPGADQLDIDGLGNQAQRVFNHASAGGTLYMEGLTVSSGKYTSNAGQGGGCLRSTGGTVQISDATFHGCVVVAPVGSDSSTRGGAIAVYGEVRLDRVTIADSQARTDHTVAEGGGLYAQGNLFIRSSLFTNNSVSASGTGAFTVGGGLFTPEWAYIVDSTIDGNLSDGGGGGGVLQRSGVIVRSTISNNHAVGGASGLAILGIGPYATPATIISSTISGNTTEASAQWLSGGLYINTDAADIRACTVTENSETNVEYVKHGAGIVFGPDTVTIAMSSTIASRNFFFDDTIAFSPSDITGATGVVISGDTNVVGWTGIAVPADTVFTTVPQLGALQDNGGPTWTHMPLADSVLIDAGNDHGDPTDQRGYPRIAGAAADIGSVEANPDDVIFAAGFE